MGHSSSLEGKSVIPCPNFDENTHLNFTVVALQHITNMRRPEQKVPTLQQTNIAMGIPIFNREYIFKRLILHAILVYQRVHHAGEEKSQNSPYIQPALQATSADFTMIFPGLFVFIVLFFGKEKKVPESWDKTPILTTPISIWAPFVS